MRPMVTINKSDDLIRRAKNIVEFVGLKGSVGDYVLNVHQLLQEYEKLDREDAE